MTNPPDAAPALDETSVRQIVEALIFAAPKPLTVSQILRCFDEQHCANPGKTAIESALSQLKEDYQNRGIGLQECASGWRFVAIAAHAAYIGKLFAERAPRYSRAFLETLAIMAYRQPVTRAEIEDIRGVAVSSNIIRSLQERDWIQVVGHKDSPGRPSLYATTSAFLDYFNLQSLADLPTLAELKDLDNFNPELDFAPEADGQDATPESASAPESEPASTANPSQGEHHD